MIFSVPVYRSQDFCGLWEVKNNSNTEFFKETVNHEFFLPAEGAHPQNLHCWSTKTSVLWQIPYTFNVFMLEVKIRNPSKCFFSFSLGGNVMDQRSGDGRFGGRFLNHRAQFNVILFSRILCCWMQELRPLWTRSSRIPTARKRSVWRNRKLRKRIGSFAEGRSLTWSASAFGLLALMIPLLISLILLSAMMMFRNSIRDEMKYYCRWPRSHLMMSWKVGASWEYVSLINSKLYWNWINLKLIRINRRTIIKDWRPWWRGV